MSIRVLPVIFVFFVNCMYAQTFEYENTVSFSFVGVECPSTTSATISVSDNFTINDLKVGLIADMDSRHHLQATLSSPQGTSVLLTSINDHGFFGGMSDWDILFDDASSGSLNDGNSDNISVPNYENDRTANPAGTLADFDGEQANGVWTLTVCDYNTPSGNGGSIVRWKLVFDGTLPCPTSSDMPISTHGTCNGTLANNDASVSISNVLNADRADISSSGASTYDGDDYVSAEAISGGTISFSGLEHGENYILRIYETGGGCYTDLPFVSADAPLSCLNIPNDVPWAGSTCNGSNIILQNGIGAVTCGVTTSTSAPDQWAFGLMNFENALPVSGRVETTSSVDVYHHPSWHVDSIGNVFGIAMNAVTGNIFLTTSSNYGAGFLGSNAIIRYGSIAGGTASGSNDSAAGGAVYKIDATTGQATVFAILPQQSVSFTNEDCESSDIATRTNSGVGLGNIVYDEDNDQYFVSNIEDGRIYRLNNTGIIQDSYDPFSNDDGVAGISDLEELVYGLAIEPGTGRLFFGGVDNTTSSSGAAPGNPGIYSITLSSGSFPGTINNTNMPAGAIYDNYESSETFHTNIPIAGGALPGTANNDLVYLISDLEFNASGDLLVGVRVSCRNSFFSSYNHFSEVNIVTKNTGTNIYDNSVTELDVSATGDYANEDTYGGVAAYVDGSGNNIIAVSSSDIINELGPHGIAVFNDPPNSGPISPLGAASYGVAGTDPKGVGGDVELWASCTQALCTQPYIGADQAICSGDTITFIAYPSQADQTDSIAGNWTISPQSPSTANITSVTNDSVIQVVFYAEGLGPFIDTVYFETVDGCRDTALMVVNTRPTFVARDTTVCISSTVDLTSLVENYASILSPVWHIGTADGSVESTPTAVVPSSLTAYFLIGNNVHGCKDTVEVTVTTFTAPIPMLSSATICAGTTTILNPGVFASYNWSSGEMTQTVTKGTGIYTVTVTDGNGCTASATAMISEGTFTATINTTCNDNGTASDDTDDYFTIEITANNSVAGVSNKYEVVYNGTVMNVGGTDYGSAVTIGTGKEFDADGTTTYSLTIRDLDDSACSIIENVGAVDNCSNCPTPVCLPVVILKE